MSEAVEVPEPHVSLLTLAQEEAQRIYDRDGACPPAVLVEESRDPSAPLHHALWSRKSQAEWAREGQEAYARLLLRRITIITDSGPQPAWVSVTIVEGERQRGHVPLSAIKSNDEWATQVRRDARTGLLGWRKRWAGIDAAAPAVEHVDRAIGSLDDTEE